jgi:hypothetical protein
MVARQSPFGGPSNLGVNPLGQWLCVLRFRRRLPLSGTHLARPLGERVCLRDLKQIWRV